MTYQYVKPTNEQIEQMQKFRDKFEKLHNEIQEIVKEENGFLFATLGIKNSLEKLQEASFWLNKAITNNDLY